MAKRAKITRSTSDEQLLRTRMCDFQLSLEKTKVQKCIEQIEEELEDKGIRFKPYYWLSDEFFTPEGVTGVAVPFYLAHPRLEKLERAQMFEAEGSGTRECLKILRHEIGHAIEHAYRLTRREKRRKIFGSTRIRYPESYTPKPYSRSYVMHLDNWYAQAHPDEDFAETFAVWLRPGSRWRKRYQGWPVMKKLEYMDELMKDIRDKPPLVRTRSKDFHYSQIRKTLGEYYEEKKDRFGLNTKEDFYDRELLKLFSDAPEYQKALSAARFIRKVRREARQDVAFYTGQYRYAIDEVIEEIIDRCEDLNLHLMKDELETRSKFFVLLTVLTMNYLHSGGYSLAL